jgi:hypothetical protein
MKDCFDRGLKEKPRMQGRVVLAVEIAADGHVESVDVQSNDGIVEKSIACGRTGILRVHFPPPGEGGTRVAMPFSLSRLPAELQLTPR